MRNAFLLTTALAIGCGASAPPAGGPSVAEAPTGGSTAPSAAKAFDPKTTVTTPLVVEQPSPAARVEARPNANASASTTRTDPVVLHLPAGKSNFNTACFSQDGRLLVTTGGGDGVVRVWDAVAGGQLASIPTKAKSIDGIAVRPDGKQMAVAVMNSDSMGVVLFSTTGGPAAHELKRASKPVYHPDGKRLAVYEFNRDNNVYDMVVYDTATGKAVDRWTPPFRAEHADYDRSDFRFSPDGKFVLAVHHQRAVLAETLGWKVVRVWDTDQDKYYLDAKFSRDGKTITCLVHEKPMPAVCRWDVQTGRELGRIAAATRSARLIAGGEYTATIEHGRPRLWDTVVGDAAFLPAVQPNDPISDLGFAVAPGIQRVATAVEMIGSGGGAGKTMLVWSIGTDGVTRLKTALESNDTRLRTQAVHMVHEEFSTDPDAATVLRRLLNDPADEVRFAAAVRLSELVPGSTSLVSLIDALDRSKDADTLLLAAHQIAEQGQKGAAARKSLARLAADVKAPTQLRGRAVLALVRVDATARPAPELLAAAIEADPWFGAEELKAVAPLLQDQKYATVLVPVLNRHLQEERHVMNMPLQKELKRTIARLRDGVGSGVSPLPRDARKLTVTVATTGENPNHPATGAYFNAFLKSVKAHAIPKEVVIDCDVDEEKWPSRVVSFPLLVRVFDRDGNYLTHFVTVERFTGSEGMFDQFIEVQNTVRANVPQSEWFRGPHAPYMRTKLLQPAGNRLAYPVAATAIKDAAMVEVGFITPK